MKKVKIVFLFLITAFLLSSCIIFKYLYFEREKVILKGIDVDSTLDIAELKLEKGGFDSILTFWALRDQIITPEQADRINSLYLKYYDTIDNEFGKWHFAWAISNYYRLGDEEVKDKLKTAYQNAINRPQTFKQFESIANEHINGTKIYMGNIHDLGKYYSQTHLIVPGNKDYLQSFKDFVEQNKTDKKLMNEIEKSRWLDKYN